MMTAFSLLGRQKDQELPGIYRNLIHLLAVLLEMNWFDRARLLFQDQRYDLFFCMMGV
jgi:hypothetical protein